MKAEIDKSSVMAALDRLIESDFKKVWRNALKKSANILVKETKTKLVANMGSAATHKSLKYGKSLRQGVKSSVRKDATEAKVHIMGDFRLKFFEKGTKERYTRKGSYSRGKIAPPLNFFAKARQNKEAEVYDSMEANLLDEIVRIYERN